jgi:hypothetical protein
LTLKVNHTAVSYVHFLTWKSPHEALFDEYNNLSFFSSGKWSTIAGALSQIDHGTTSDVWGVNSNERIYRLKDDRTWMNIPGLLKHVTVGEAGVWGTNRHDNIYFRRGSSWVHISGKLKQIDSGTGSIVYGVNRNDNIYCRLGKT